jgi:hypothetical protein
MKAYDKEVGNKLWDEIRNKGYTEQITKTP